MNGEQMYDYLKNLGKKGREDVIDVTWWDVTTVRGIADDMADDPDAWLSGLSEEERKAFVDLSVKDLSDVLEEALNEVDGDGEHSESIRQAIREGLVRKARKRCRAEDEEVVRKHVNGIRLDSLVFDIDACRRFIRDNFGEKSDITPERIFDRLSGYMVQFDEWPEDDWYGIEFDTGETLDANIFGSEYSGFNENITLYYVKKAKGSEYPEGDYDHGYNVYKQ